MRTRVTYIFSLIFLFTSQLNAEVIRVDNKHQRLWNQFADKALALHKKQIKKYPHQKATKIGGYGNLPDFYLEEIYRATSHGKVLSKVTWEKEQPKNLHTIEVFVYDEQSRMVRDYSAAYLPSYRSAPTQTLLTLHTYNKGVHAMRTFDASADHILDKCVGKFAEDDINILLDEDELHQARYEYDSILESDAYLHCFKGMPEKPGKFLPPG